MRLTAVDLAAKRRQFDPYPGHMADRRQDYKSYNCGVNYVKVDKAESSAYKLAVIPHTVVVSCM